MKESQQKTLVVDRQAWFMRFLRWAWESVPEDASFCLLFWMLLLSPVGVFGHVTDLGVRSAGRGLRTVSVAQKGADRVAATLRAHEKAFGVTLNVLFASAALSVVGILVLALYRAAWWALLIPGNVVCLCFLAWTLRDNAIVRVLATGYHATKTRTCPRVEFVDSDRPAA